ncbi:MAG: NTPase [Planctomycetota bacterium]|jgi:nucleoside-triphosphatase
MEGVNLFLTGRPGCGKTTAVTRVLEGWTDEARGMVTEEVRSPSGARTGFRLRTLDGREGTLARTGVKGKPRVGRYRVFLEDLETVAVPAVTPGDDGGTLIVIDEVGKMECFSPAFRDAVESALDSAHPVLGTVPLRASGFPSRVKARPDVTILEVTAENRDDLPEAILSILGGKGLDEVPFDPEKDKPPE